MQAINRVKSHERKLLKLIDYVTVRWLEANRKTLFLCDIIIQHMIGYKLISVIRKLLLSYVKWQKAIVRPSFKVVISSQSLKLC